MDEMIMQRHVEQHVSSRSELQPVDDRRQFLRVLVLLSRDMFCVVSDRFILDHDSLR